MRIEFVDDDGDPQPAPVEYLGQRPHRSSRLGRIVRRPAVRWGAAVLVLAVLAATGLLAQRHHRMQAAAASRARAVAPVRDWVSSSSGDAVNTTTTGSGRDCPPVDVRATPPAQRITSALLAVLPGYTRRSVVQTIDQAGHLCMLQVSVAGSGTVVLLRVQSGSDTEVRATDDTVDVVRSGSGARSAGYGVVPAHDGRSVVVGWVGPDAPGPTVVRDLARAEASRW